MQYDALEEQRQCANIGMEYVPADAEILQQLFQRDLVHGGILPKFEQIDDFFEVDEYPSVVVLGDLDAALGEDVLLAHLAEALALPPPEHLGEVVDVVGHEGVEHVVVLQEEHAVLDQVVYELAQDHLLRHLRPEAAQPLVDLPQRFLGQEDLEVAVAELQSLLHVHVAEALDERGDLDRQVVETRPVDVLVLVVLHQFGQTRPAPGELAEDEVVDDDPEGEGIALGGVHVPLQGLQGHEEGAAHLVALDDEGVDIGNAFGEAEIADLPLSVLEEDVGGFEVAVHDVVAGEVLAAPGDLVDDAAPLDVLAALGVAFQIAALAVLGDQVAVVGGVLDINKLHDVLVVQFLHDIDFVVEEVDVGDVHLLEFDHLDGVVLSFVVVLDSLVDLAAVAAADQVAQVEAVPPDSFLPRLQGLYLLSIALLHVHCAVCIYQLDLLR